MKKSLPPKMHIARQLLLLGFITSLGITAQAGCSRTVNVPVAPIGLSVFETADKTIEGVYPDVLRGLSSKDGCEFMFSVVPRARLEAMFEAGRADMLVPATRSGSRDASGVFVPLIYSRATLLSLASERPALRSAQDLIERHNLKVGLVRGFDFGAAYQALVKELSAQGRVVQDVDAASVARLLQAGTVDLTIMAPSILAGAIHNDPKTAGMTEKLRSEPIEELPWGDSGVYLSRTSLSDADRKVLQELLERSARSGAVWRAFQRHYPANTLTGSIRARQ